MITTRHNTNLLTNFLSTSYVMADWDKENALIVLNWTHETRYMQEADFKNTLLDTADFVKTNEIKYWLTNTKDFDYIIEPKLQEWAAGKFNKQLINARLQKMAIITPVHFLIQIALRQTTGEMTKKHKYRQCQFSYFDEVGEATDWLLE